MSTIEKFQRLKKVLTGPAVAFVENVPMSDDSYSEVWKDMKTYYDNPRRIVTSHVQAIINMKPLAQARASDIQTMLDQFKAHIRALKTAGHDGNADIFQLHVLLSKFDVATQQKWEAKLTTSKEIPDLQCLYNVIEKRILMLEIEPERLPVQKKRSMGEPLGIKSSLHAKTIKFHLCQKDHLVFKCPDLIAAVPDTRLKLINEKK